MGLSFSVYQKELSSKGFNRAYEGLRAECPAQFPFADPGNLIAFFHDQTADLDRKDAILYELITRYRNDNRHRDIAPLFIVLFTPVFASIYAYSRRGHPGIDREDLIQDICLLFIQIIKESTIRPYKVAGQIAGTLRNRVRFLVNLASGEEFVEIKGDGTDAFETDGTCAADSEADDIERIATEITAFLDRLVRTGKITRKDKRILMENLIGGKSLRDIASPRDVERLKHRRRQVMDLIKKIFCKQLILYDEKRFFRPWRNFFDVQVGGIFFRRMVMHSPEPTNTTRIVRDTFIDMALYLECLFLLHGVNDILVEDIIHCMEEGYAKAIKNLKRINKPRPKTKKTTAVDRFLKKLEQERN